MYGRWASTTVISRVFFKTLIYGQKTTVEITGVKKKTLNYRGNSTYNMVFSRAHLVPTQQIFFFVFLISELKIGSGSVWDFWIRASRRQRELRGN